MTGFDLWLVEVFDYVLVYAFILTNTKLFEFENGLLPVLKTGSTGKYRNPLLFLKLIALCKNLL
jgi:hypothetical protein